VHKSITDKSVSFLRRISLSGGILAVLVSILANPLGLSVGGRISWNQITIALFGLALILVSVLGRRVTKVWKGLAIILLNTLVILVVIDLISLAIIKVWHPEELEINERKFEARLLDARIEERMAWGRYEPYVVWRADTSVYFVEEIDPDGFRRTPGSVTEPGSYGVFFFGGSTVWGTGVPDSCTIPAQLLRLLNAHSHLEFDVRNYGQLGYVSTQELLELLFQLRDGNVPDLVIFLDGMNDAAAAYQSGIAGTHQNYPAIRDKLESGYSAALQSEEQHPALLLLRQSNTGTLISLLKTRLAPDDSPAIISYRTLGVDAEALAAEVAAVLIGNYDLVSQFADHWGFCAAFFIQPTVWTGSKELTDEELRLHSGGGDITAIGSDEAWEPLLLQSYGHFNNAADTSEVLFNLVNVFDGSEETVYTDNTGVHLTAEGNRLVANQIFRDLRESGLLDEILTDSSVTNGIDNPGFTP
jgi:lysophospholipase L1-like esterase